MPPSTEQLADLTHVQIIRTEALADWALQDRFAAFDALTPDEPIWAWHAVKQVVMALARVLALPSSQTAARPRGFLYEALSK